MCLLRQQQEVNTFGGREPVSWAKVEARVKKIKGGRAAVTDEGKYMIRNGVNLMLT